VNGLFRAMLDAAGREAVDRLDRWADDAVEAARSAARDGREIIAKGRRAEHPAIRLTCALLAAWESDPTALAGIAGTLAWRVAEAAPTKTVRWAPAAATVATALQALRNERGRTFGVTSGQPYNFTEAGRPRLDAAIAELQRYQATGGQCCPTAAKTDGATHSLDCTIHPADPPSPPGAGRWRVAHSHHGGAYMHIHAVAFDQDAASHLGVMAPVHAAVGTVCCPGAAQSRTNPIHSADCADSTPAPDAGQEG
jgi:hypothetical protein